jgi:hypothetical protein
MDKTEALLKHMRDLAQWLEIQAREFDNGSIRPANGDEGAQIAANYRHKLRNITAVVQAYSRLTARDSKRGV